MTSKSTGLTLLEAHNLNRWAAKKPWPAPLPIKIACFENFQKSQKLAFSYGIIPPLEIILFCVFAHPSSWPVREVRLRPPNFDRGLKTIEKMKNVVLCVILCFFCRRCFHGENCRSKSPVLKISKKVEKWAFSCGKIRPLEMIFFAVFPTHLLGPSERYVLDPRTLIGDSKRGFPAMIVERSKMIIFDHFKVKSALQVPCKI